MRAADADADAIAGLPEEDGVRALRRRARGRWLRDGRDAVRIRNPRLGTGRLLAG